MTQPDNSDPNTPKSADATSTESHSAMVSDAASGHTPEASTSSPSTAASGGEGASAPAAEGAGASAGENAGDGGEGDADGGDGETEGEGEAEGEGAQAGAEGAAPGAPTKKKRRRRRKKKNPGEAGASAEGAPQGEGAQAEGAEGQPQGGPRPPRPKKERPERERPAFNVGDVVFGKVLEVTEDALFVDLSGKARALFDLRELLITEEEAEEYNRAHKQDRREAQAAGETEEALAQTGETPDATAPEATGSASTLEASATEAAAPAPDASASASAPAPEAPAPEPVAVAPPAAEASPTEASAPAATEASAAEAAPEAGGASAAVAGGASADEKGPQPPLVIFEPGAPFVGLVHNDGGRGGLVVLTHHPKRVSKAKPVVADASRSGALVFGLVTGTIKGGVEVDVDGLRAFAPASHVELRPGADLSHLVGKRLPFAVTQYAKRGRDVVLSRRALLEAEYKEKREEALKNVEIGSVVDGIVRTVVPFGAFVDVGGVEGLVPLSEMSHNRADGPRDVFKVNETARVKILRVDEKGKLWLSRKAAIDDPWGQVAQKYAQGTRHTGKIVRLQPFGAFVELEAGIDGLIHSVDLSVKRIEHPEEVVKVGQEIEVVVASVDSRQHRIALHPAPTGEAANEEPQRIAMGKSVKVVVVAIETGGLAVRILGATGRQARGFISAAATGTPRGTELRKLFPVGKELEVKIVEVDPRRGELKLSIKALNEQTERDAYQNYRAQVKREAKFGTLADLLAKRNITPTK